MANVSTTYPASFPNTSSAGTIPLEVASFYDAVLLERVVSNFVHMRWAQIRDVPANFGTGNIKFRRYANLSAATTPLTEGTTPAGSSLSVTDIQATVKQYGDFTQVSDVLTYQSADKVLMEAAEILGDQAADTLDELTRDILAAGTSVFYGGTAVSRVTVAAGDNITLTMVQKAVRLLTNNKSRKITKMVNATTGIGTTPLQQSYIGICDPYTAMDLKNLSGFVPIEKYASTTTVMEGEIGKLDEVRFIQTPNSKVFAGAGAAAIDVHATIIIAANAYGVTRISGQAMKNIVKPLGSGGTTDPLDQRATSGWKATFVAKILNDDFMTRLEHAVSS